MIKREQFPPADEWKLDKETEAFVRENIKANVWVDKYNEEHNIKDMSINYIKNVIYLMANRTDEVFKDFTELLKAELIRRKHAK